MWREDRLAILFTLPAILFRFGRHGESDDGSILQLYGSLPHELVERDDVVWVLVVLSLCVTGRGDQVRQRHRVV